MKWLSQRFSVFCLLLLGYLASTGCVAVRPASEMQEVDPCAIGTENWPELIYLSSQILGGKLSSSPKGPFVGEVPPMFILYDSGTAIFARKQTLSNKKEFWGYACKRLAPQIVKGIRAQLEDMPELHEYFEGSNESLRGVNALIHYKNRHECTHFEMTGSVAEARALSQRSRSSVNVQVKPSILKLMEELASFGDEGSTAYFPRQVVIELRPEKDHRNLQGSIPWPEQDHPLSEINAQSMSILPPLGVRYFYAKVSSQLLKDLAKMINNPVSWKSRSWQLRYRFVLPHEESWAAPYPARMETYSMCNRFVPKTNFWTLFGFQGGKQSE